MCKPSPYILDDETYVLTENGFICIPAKPIQIDFNCEGSLMTKEITQVTRITGSRCKIYFNVNELNKARLSLDETESMMR